MTTIDLAPSAIRLSQYTALEGKPLHRTYALLQPVCPSCEHRVRSLGFADWVRTEGIIITLWQCVSHTCQLSGRNSDTTLRQVTDVVDDADVLGPHQVFGLAAHTQDCGYAADPTALHPSYCCRPDDLWHTWDGLEWAMTEEATQGHPDLNQCQCETVSQHWAIVDREATATLPLPADGEYRTVAWHPEDKPGQVTRATLCGYHYRLARSCDMLDADLGAAHGSPTCEVCR